MPTTNESAYDAQTKAAEALKTELEALRLSWKPDLEDYGSLDRTSALVNGTQVSFEYDKKANKLYFWLCGSVAGFAPEATGFDFKKIAKWMKTLIAKEKKGALDERYPCTSFGR